MKTYQVGGTHYQKYKVQPIDLIMMCKWDFVQGNIAKYVLRYKYRDGVKDLRKALQYVEFGHDGYSRAKDFNDVNYMIIDQFVEVNHIDIPIRTILFMIENKNWQDLTMEIELLISNYETEKQKQ